MPCSPALRWTSLPALVAAALLVLLGATPSNAAAPRTRADAFVATDLPDSAVGHQARWLIDASLRPQAPGARELREHLSARLLGRGGSLARRGRFSDTLVGEHGLRLEGVIVEQPAALAAAVRGRGGRRLVLTTVVDRAGQLDAVTLGPPVALPRPTGRATVGSDVVGLVDRTRANRRLVVTRFYPAAGPSRSAPLAHYVSPDMAAALAQLFGAGDPGAAAGALAAPSVRTNARASASPRPGRLPVVLFSPGGGAPRVLYQALAEDLASHGYLVVAVDHTGDAPVEIGDGSIIAASGSGIPDRTRLDDMRFVLRRLNTMAPGPRADRRRVAAIGHSIGGSTAAALLRAEPSLRAGVDMDGIILGPAARRGVARPFLVMAAGRGALALPSVRGLLRHSRGPRLALEFRGFDHFSFSDAPVIAPAASGVGRRASANDLAVQRAYLRAFLDRYVRGDRRSHLLDGPSARWPQVSIRVRRRCCS